MSMLCDRASKTERRTTSLWLSVWGTVVITLAAIGPAAARVDPPISRDTAERLAFDAADSNPLQAIQLADADTSGTGSSSLLDSLQKRLGVDRVDVTSTR